MAVSASDRADYVARDRDVWTAFLERCPGFVRKQLWLPVDRPGVLVIQIWWVSRDAWKAVTAEQVAEIDAQMGVLLRPVLCREYSVLES